MLGTASVLPNAASGLRSLAVCHSSCGHSRDSPRPAPRGASARLLCRSHAGGNASSRQQGSSASWDETISSLDQVLGSKDSTDEEEVKVLGASDSAERVSAIVREPLEDTQDNAASKDLPGIPQLSSMVDGLKGLVKSQIKEKLERPDLLSFDDSDVVLPKATPWLSYIILAIVLAVYAIGLAEEYIKGPAAAESYFLRLAKINGEIEAGEYYRLLSSNFVHDSFIHLASSCYALATIAPEVETVLGPATFLAVYTLSGFAGSVATFVCSDTLTVGASSGIFGIIGALAAFLWKNRDVYRNKDEMQAIALVIIFNLWIGSSSETAVDNLAHLCGLGVGGYIGWGLGPLVIKRRTSSAKGSKDGQTAEFDRRGSPWKWLGFASFAISLGLAVAGTVASRTGGLPFPKGFPIIL